MLICSVPTISRVLLQLCAPADYVIRLLDLFLHSFFMCVSVFLCLFSVCICFLFTCTLCTIFIINK